MIQTRSPQVPRLESVMQLMESTFTWWVEVTDYEFPPTWGLMNEQEKAQWYLKERVYRQARRQYRAGMWNQWDEQRLNERVTEKNEYRFDGDIDG